MANNEIFGGFGADYDNASVNTGNAPQKIEPGAYVLQIKTAHLETVGEGKKKIVLYFDIAEGDYAGYYAALYAYEKGFDNPEKGKKAKWKGTFDIWWPDREADDDKYKSAMSRLKAAITCINESNPTRPPINPAVSFGSADFINKYVGGAFGAVEWYWEGKTGWTTKCRWLAKLDDVRAGKVTTPEPKENENKTSVAAPATPEADLSGYKEIINDGDVPF